ncbi:MAG: flagellar basal body rod protein FlgB [Lachnospiraceae bacterium]|nr:flagellar basal body rod protein FlgB [Lachnospiraceae bacterium]
MSSILFGNGIALSERALDMLWLRQNITLNNIANDDTPDFKSQYLTFEDTLAEQVKAASATGSAENVRQAISSAPAIVRTTENETHRLDGNNVDMSQEQIDLVRTAYQYQYLTNSINNEIKRLQEAAKPF